MNKATNKENSTKKESSKEPKFDFYTILPELEVFIPESEIHSGEKTTSKKKQEPSKIKSNKKYKHPLILQIRNLKYSKF